MNDEDWMRHALSLADKAQAVGEIPVGAVLVQDDKILGEGWNLAISHHDATAHAEIQAIRAAGLEVSNYRLPNTTLYVTLEPCPMCAGAIIHARVERVVFGAFDPKSGAAGSVFDLLADQRHNHRVSSHGGVLEQECAEKLRNFFRMRRKQLAATKKAAQKVQ